MGCFDSIMFNCPKCGAELEFQSKAGYGMMHKYSPSSAPGAIAGDAIGHIMDCEECNKSYRITGHVILTGLELIRKETK